MFTCHVPANVHYVTKRGLAIFAGFQLEIVASVKVIINCFTTIN